MEAFQTNTSLTNVQDSAPWMLLKLQFKHSRQRTRPCLATWFKQQLRSNVIEQLSVKSWDGIEVSGCFFACPWISLPCHFLANRKPLKDLLHLPAKLYAGFRGGKGTVGWERSSTWGVAFATCLWDHVGIPGFALLISSVHGSDSGCSAPASDWARVAFATRPDSVPYAKTNIIEQLH